MENSLTEGCRVARCPNVKPKGPCRPHVARLNGTGNLTLSLGTHYQAGFCSGSQCGLLYLVAGTDADLASLRAAGYRISDARQPETAGGAA